MKKKVVAVLLAACLSFSLSACSGGESESSSTSASQTEVVSKETLINSMFNAPIVLF